MAATLDGIIDTAVHYKHGALISFKSKLGSVESSIDLTYMDTYNCQLIMTNRI
jgi:hypothetical protein